MAMLPMNSASKNLPVTTPRGDVWPKKDHIGAESAMLLRGAAGTSGAQKLVTRPTGRPEEGTTATGGAQRAEGVELGKSDVQWPGGFNSVCRP